MGIDGVTVEEFEDRAIEELNRLEQKLRDGSYRTAAGPAGDDTKAGRLDVIEEELGLRVDPKKTRLLTVYQGIPYLGFELRCGRGGKIEAWIKEKAPERFKERVRELTRRNQPIKVGELLGRLCVYLRSWGPISPEQRTGSSSESSISAWHGVRGRSS